MKKYLRVKQVAEHLGISKSSVWRWVQESILPEPIRIAGRTTVWRADEVEAAIEKIAAEQEQ